MEGVSLVAIDLSRLWCTAGHTLRAAVLMEADQRLGDVAEIPTDLCNNTSGLLVSFDPASQLHWVDSAEGAESPCDPDFLRDLCFNNRWLAGALGGDLPRGVRMAPACPLFREPVQCSRCEAWVASPSVSAQGWLDHFGFAVQSAAGRAPVCMQCSRQSGM